jgi:putative protease
MEQTIGQVTHYYTRLGVAVLELKDALKVGDEIHILGHTTNFNQRVESLEIEHQQVQAVEPGAEVALKVVEKARRGDVVYIVKQ